MRSKPSNLRAETDTTGHGQRARADHAVAVKSLRCTGSASAKHSKSGTPRGPNAARTSHGVARDRARGNTTRFRARSGTPTCARRHARTRSGGRTRLPAWSLVHELQAPTNATHENARHEMLDMGDYARHASEGEGNSGSTHGKTHIMLLLAIDASARRGARTARLACR